MTSVSDTGALAAVAAARELKLRTIRADAARLAAIAVRGRHAHRPTSPRSCPPRPTTGPAGAAPAASAKPTVVVKITTPASLLLQCGTIGSTSGSYADDAPLTAIRE